MPITNPLYPAPSPGSGGQQVTGRWVGPDPLRPHLVLAPLSLDAITPRTCTSACSLSSPPVATSAPCSHPLKPAPSSPPHPQAVVAASRAPTGGPAPPSLTPQTRAQAASTPSTHTTAGSTTPRPAALQGSASPMLLAPSRITGTSKSRTATPSTRASGR